METDDSEEPVDRRHSGSLAEYSGQELVFEYPKSDTVCQDCDRQNTPDGPVLPSTGLHINTISSSPFQAASVKAVEERKGTPFAAQR